MIYGAKVEPVEVSQLISRGIRLAVAAARQVQLFWGIKKKLHLHHPELVLCPSLSLLRPSAGHICFSSETLVLPLILPALLMLGGIERWHRHARSRPGV